MRVKHGKPAGRQLQWNDIQCRIHNNNRNKYTYISIVHGIMCKKNNKQQKIVTVKALASLSYCFSVSIDTDTFTRKAENDFLDRFFYMNIAHAIGFLSGGF